MTVQSTSFFSVGSTKRRPGYQLKVKMIKKGRPSSNYSTLTSKADPQKSLFKE